MRIRAMEVFEEADADSGSRVVVLRGAGRTFSAGYDLIRRGIRTRPNAGMPCGGIVCSRPARISR